MGYLSALGADAAALAPASPPAVPAEQPASPASAAAAADPARKFLLVTPSFLIAPPSPVSSSAPAGGAPRPARYLGTFNGGGAGRRTARHNLRRRCRGLRGCAAHRRASGRTSRRGRGGVAAESWRRKTRLRRETGAEAGVSYGIPSEAGPPASFSRRRAHLRSKHARNRARAEKSGPTQKGRPAKSNAPARLRVHRSAATPCRRRPQQYPLPRQPSRQRASCGCASRSRTPARFQRHRQRSRRCAPCPPPADRS